MIKVGIDIQSTVGEKTGIGYYTQNLIKGYNSLDRIEPRYYKNSAAGTLSTFDRIKWESFSLPKYAAKDKVDILHIPGFAGPVSRGKYKRVTTVHDLIGMVYPQNLAPVSRFYWQRWLPACVKKSDFIIADSENTRKDIIRLTNIKPERIRVIYLAPAPKFKPIDKSESLKAILKNYGINKKYILNVGTIEPRKNISNLIAAFGRYLKAPGRDDLTLVIAGKKGWDYQNCYNKAIELNLKEKVIFCDYVSDEDLVVLYNFAEVFVYPSFYEGFGLPVLEAMSCGAPVICSNASSLPEIAGDAALFIDPDSIDSIKGALINVLDNKETKTSLSKKSIGQSKKFSWGKTAAETIAVYKKVLN